jgi:prepilin-type N-terminal cleavage/methylation domain-containing protein
MTGHHNNTQTGLTIVELLTVIAIVGIVLALPFLSMMGERKQKPVEVGQASVYQALSSARSRAVSGVVGTAHGVCVRTDDVVVYKGGCTDCSTCTGEVYPLPPGVSATPANITFDRLTGSTASFVEIEVTGFNATTRTVRVYEHGLIE